MSTAALTSRQHACLAFIEEFIRSKGYAPTIREIGKHFGFSSTNGVTDHLNALERKGYLARPDGLCRAMSVLVSAEQAPVISATTPMSRCEHCGHLVRAPR